MSAKEANCPHQVYQSALCIVSKYKKSMSNSVEKWPALNDFTPHR
jgi:hypothetical protein